MSLSFKTRYKEHVSDNTMNQLGKGSRWEACKFEVNPMAKKGGGYEDLEMNGHTMDWFRTDHLVLMESSWQSTINVLQF